MNVNNLYTSVACNRTTECADWGPNGLIAFGACNAIAILNPKHNGNSAKIVQTFVQHTKRVSTVKWLNEKFLLSGGDDNIAVLWQVAANNSEDPQYTLLKGHSQGVNGVAGICRPTTGIWLLATASSDSSVKLWNFEEDNKKVDCIQTITLKSGFCFCIRLTLLPETDNVLMALSSDDETVSLWSQPNDSEFTLAHTLTGHENWVRGLDFVNDGTDLLLASGSLDNFIRLWRISPRSEEQTRENNMNLCNLNDNDSIEIRVEEKILKLGINTWYAVSLESVLYGHEGWVYGVQWHKTKDQELRLLSASIDKTLIVWAPTEDGVWLEQVRVGEVGGNSMGFFGGKFAPDGLSIMAHSYQGGFHIWNQDATRPHLWTSNVIVSGHFGEVRDLAWEHKGEYLLTVSADQTTRLHAPWVQENNEKSTTWHELARPQVHGYDIQCLALLSRYKFASGAEEKIVRAFQATSNFVENFHRISKLQNDDALLNSLPKGASVPSLGLSNKAVYKVETENSRTTGNKDDYPETYFVPMTLDTPPLEEALMQNTLWPEVQKLYGHGYEIYALAATSDGKLLASSCRATNAEHAQIILWNTENWKQLQKLSSHQLTVTQLRFSPDGRYLLSVSRDRRWSLFERQEGSDMGYVLAASTDKSNGAHTRIIWSCDWSPNGHCFATSSRDGKVVVWSKQSEQQSSTSSSLHGWQALHTIDLKTESITAVAFATQAIANGSSYILALGCESGIIKIYQLNIDGSLCQLLLELNQNRAHHRTVKRLQFRPLSNNANESISQFQLASCGEDHLVRIYDISLT